MSKQQILPTFASIQREDLPFLDYVDPYIPPTINPTAHDLIPVHPNLPLVESIQRDDSPVLDYEDPYNLPTINHDESDNTMGMDYGMPIPSAPVHHPDLEHHQPPNPIQTPTECPDENPRTNPRADSVFERLPHPQEIIKTSSTTWYWCPILMLSTWLHLHHGLSHRGISLFLGTLRLIFIALGLLSVKDDAPTDLRTTFSRLNINDHFLVAPMCPECYRVFLHELAQDMQCTNCNIPLYKDMATSVLGVPLTADDPFLSSWKTQICAKKTRKPLPGPDGGKFFDNSPQRDAPEELRVAVTLGFDG
ncbi:hypothetical protein PHLCEN_2v3432 [Hermanssonia centrifuga]|uniref:Uncharacterized protein n=1 Tax=Hermanssonia centrifuga TaxID=98765 RepID=A0A2R6QIQ1_9APHY|nr:hypothetical protein PHLCEN_2v3432 [Hermanssonia centrifuga]